MQEDVRETAEESEGQPIDYSSIIKPSIQYELYNPSDRSMSFSKAGVDFYLPARDKRWRGKDAATGQVITYPKPGVLPVWGLPEQKISALQVVQFAVGFDGVSGSVGVNGVRALFGDARDKDVEKDAADAWLRKQLADWTTTTQNHERSVRKAQDDGTPPPHPPKLVREAYEGLAKYGAEAEAFLPVRCGTCNWGFPNDQRMWEHVLAMHKDRKTEAEDALKVGRTESTVEKVEKQPVPPPPTMSKEDALEAARLLDSGHSDDVKPSKK